jgi:hypothetical protein
MQQVSIQDTEAGRVPVERYAYYRRCQEFRRNGEQCKAPAEKDAHICHAHASQRAMAVRLERERRAVLAEAVEQMRTRGKPEFEMADLFMDFKSIQVTIAVMAQALIDARIDCKTAGRLAVELQGMSKLLWMVHKKCKTNKNWPQICADERRLNQGKELRGVAATSAKPVEMSAWAANQREDTQIKEIAVGALKKHRGWSNGPPQCAQAA